MFYERVTPVIGDVLSNKCVGIINPESSGRIINFLSSCGITKYKIRGNKQQIKKIENELVKHNNIEKYEIDNFAGNEKTDLVIGLLTEAIELSFSGSNCLFGAFSKDGLSTICLNSLPGEIAAYNENFYFNWLDLSNQLAHYAVAVLLENTLWQQKEIVEFLRKNKQIYSGTQVWPWYQAGAIPDQLQSMNYRRKQLEQIPNGELVAGKITQLNKTVLIAGCGSIGSVIADCLSLLVTKIILVDPKKVSAFNPVRQEYHTEQVGKKKVTALAQNLQEKELLKGKKLEIFPVVAELTSENTKKFIAILEKEKPDIVILATASTNEYELAEILWNLKIPHISLRCYPRAKWWEIIIVVPPYTSCFGCIRGHLYMGQLPSLTEEQVARYDPDYRPGELEGEPATKPDSARCAEIGTRVVYQMLSEKKEWWFSALLKHNRTVLLGGNRVEKNGSEFCYGIREPGQVVAFGPENLNSPDHECLFCGRVIKEKSIQSVAISNV